MCERGIARDHRVGKDQTVRSNGLGVAEIVLRDLLIPVYANTCGEVTACRKTAEIHFVCRALPRGKVVAYVLNGAECFQHCDGKRGIQYAVMQDADIASARKKAHGYRFRLTLGGEAVTAAGQYQHSGARADVVFFDITFEIWYKHLHIRCVWSVFWLR